MTDISVSIPDIAAKVFPSRCHIVPAKEANPDNRFWVVPGKGGYPRWFLPQNPKVGLRGLDFWRPYDFSSRLKWQAVLAAYRAGILNTLPGVTAFGWGSDTPVDWGHLGWKEETQPVPVVYLGEPLARAKAVTFLVNPAEAQCTYLAKVPIGNSAANKIRRETQALGLLQREKPGMAPEPLFLDEGAGIGGQRVRPVQPTPRKITRGHLGWLEGMKTGSGATLGKAAADLEERLRQVLGDAWANYEARLDPVFQGLNDGRPLSAVWVHGDFAPWNFKRLNDGNLMAIDWEEAIQSGLPFYDLIHFFFVQVDLPERHEGLLGKMYRSPLVKRYLDAFGMDEVMGQKVFRYFVLDYWCRRLEDGDLALAETFYRMSVTPLLRDQP